jgi:L-glyceraldehyde 3-phosphate reductase
MTYRRCGQSGLRLPAIALGLWHSFGTATPQATKRVLCRTAFDLGITHFDLANNYGPPPGAAETAFGEILRQDFRAHRDELIISTKAGYVMWDGPYGDGGSRKYLMSSCDQSLRRLGLDYVDIFYHHRPDPDTPLAETMGALAQIVRSGKALHIGLSNYRAAETRQAAAILRDLGVPCLVHQPRYSMLDRWTEADQLTETLGDLGMGAVAFSPLGQGLLTDRYLKDIPADSRARNSRFLTRDRITEDVLARVRELGAIATRRGQSLAQMALAWVLRDPRITSALIGASRPDQVADCAAALDAPAFEPDDLARIDRLFPVA